ncbi:YceI family protein [Dyadobacter sp. CY312]|uniref:YceI family protein n=1 Tax=Dyadobacter sp. CY312 TaxID=2907303 RepID=UPI001F2D0CBA|nr:YceI family protein [Dyadobacter sp. CY312]MCE7042361.1 YceI family protein [Dyadobacter sp. CY312]
MSKYLSIAFILVVGRLVLPLETLQAQSMFSTSAGNTKFSSETPLENINAENKKSQAILNTSTGEVAMRMNMKDFSFPNKLMQEHFNENYIESDKYPTATFSGKIDQAVDYSRDGEYDASATGKFTVHGVTKTRTIKGKIKVAGGKILLTSTFLVALADHKIEVPQIVFVKIAQNITVKADYTLQAVK